MIEAFNTFYPQLQVTVNALIQGHTAIPIPRKQELDQLAAYIQQQLDKAATIQLTFVCTHNSRRSHMSQILTQTAAAYYGIPKVNTYSGGTEATAFNPRAVATLSRMGFEIVKTAEAQNPIYHVRFGKDAPAMTAFSKVYSDPPNPKDNFCAVMTCSQADEACPVVFGATACVSVPYEDPMLADNTPQEVGEYDKRAYQIGREMFYVFSLIKKP